MHQARLVVFWGVLLVLATPGALIAQRTMHWDSVEVSAYLDSGGQLRVIEVQTMVFTGNWNGGERKFRLRPGQHLSLESVSGPPAGSRPMTEDSRLDHVGDYWLTGTTLRWRSRLPSDPPFSRTSRRYEVRYTLSGVLGRDGDHYLLDHDFAFADREGRINRFVLRPTLDPGWRPLSPLQTIYTAGPLPPGRSFVLRLPLASTRDGIERTTPQPSAREVAIEAPPVPSVAIGIFLGATMLIVGWFFAREQRSGRFTPVTGHGVDPAWLREHILKYPAEVVGAAWDGHIGRAEVVALIARLVGEGKLESEIDQHGGGSSMTLRLKADRRTFERQESTLVDGLFFEGRTETSTEAVKAHYQDTGFDPAAAIRGELQQAVEAMLPEHQTRRSFRWGPPLLSFSSAALFMVAWLVEGRHLPSLLIAGLMQAVACVGWIAGAVFRAHIDWGRTAAFACLAPAMVIAAGMTMFLLWFGGPLSVERPLYLVAVITLAIALINSLVNALKSREGGTALALRKTLAKGRAYFAAEFDSAPSELRREWYPWVLAFGLDRHAPEWSTRGGGRDASDHDSPNQDSSRPGSTSESWTGFRGGGSGGAGASASWAVAAGGMATPVREPVSDSTGGSSSDGGSSSSSDSGSSSSGSSGGGGGGGW